ncbi:MAG: energy transducer TonB [Planctomycetes bacterium]|nr:energy transducer TonB [Planctomycetota bacterium]
MSRSSRITRLALSASAVLHAAFIACVAWAGIASLGARADEKSRVGRHPDIMLKVSFSDPAPQQFDLTAEPASQVVVLMDSARVADRRFFRSETKMKPVEMEPLASANPSDVMPPEVVKPTPRHEPATAGREMHRWSDVPRRATQATSIPSVKAMIPSGSTGIARARFYHQPPPTIPITAYRQGLHGTVHLRLRITADGHVSNVAVTRSSGHPILDAAAVGAVRRWRSEPVVRDGQPATTTHRVIVDFPRR